MSSVRSAISNTDKYFIDIVIIFIIFLPKKKIRELLKKKFNSEKKKSIMYFKINHHCLRNRDLCDSC